MAFSFNTPEEMVTFLKTDDEGKKVLEQVTSGYIKPEHIDGLVKSKESILAEKKKLKTDYDELVNKVQNYEEKFDKMESDYDIKLREELEKQTSQSDVNNSDTIKQVNDLKTLLTTKERQWDREKEKISKSSESLSAELEALNKEYNTVLIENSLNRHFDEMNVKEEHRRLLKDAYRGRAVIELDADSKRDVLIIDGEGRLTASDYFSNWAESKEAKYYLKAPQNNGGGTSGGVNAYKGRDLAAEYNKAVAEGRNADAIALTQMMHSQAQGRYSQAQGR
jgi:hypothetical protein